MSELVYVSRDELAYYHHVRASPVSNEQFDQIVVHRLDRELRESSVAVCVPTAVVHSIELVVVDGCLLLLSRSVSAASRGTLDVLVVDCLRRTRVDIHMSVQHARSSATAHEGRLFVHLMSEDSSSPLLSVYCFNRDAALLWHACFPLPPDFWLGRVMLVPDGRLTALIWQPEDDRVPELLELVVLDR
eukprot:TRINITY_DN5715_c0_g1_i1.p2 TRINITY_DN5715_c0_g1~~TRINITY_DN5715_c0_g1_i1.p2  ORF type:complete len:188 (-),score=19.43 TRINITY_DN5715_c0_g1_i1:18-581(-)